MLSLVKTRSLAESGGMVQLEGHSGSEAVITSARVTRFVCWYEVDLGPIRAAVLTHSFSKEFQRGLLALFLRDEALEDFAFEFESPPKVMAFALIFTNISVRYRRQRLDFIPTTQRFRISAPGIRKAAHAGCLRRAFVIAIRSN